MSRGSVIEATSDPPAPTTRTPRFAPDATDISDSFSSSFPSDLNSPDQERETPTFGSGPTDKPVTRRPRCEVGPAWSEISCRIAPDARPVYLQ